MYIAPNIVSKDMVAYLLLRQNIDHLMSYISTVISETGFDEPEDIKRYVRDGLKKFKRVLPSKARKQLSKEQQTLEQVLFMYLGSRAFASDWLGIDIESLDQLPSIFGVPDIIFDQIYTEIIRSGSVKPLSFIENDPYMAKVGNRLNNISYGRWRLERDVLAPYSLAIGSGHSVETFFGHVFIPHLCCLNDAFDYPILREYDDNETGHAWMSITINEILSMRKHINLAKGNVLTLGCGMGYYAYMAALKGNVESVSIVEKERDVLDVFENAILPYFEPKIAQKVKLIHADAFDFINGLDDGKYDYCFADIWKDYTDVTLWVKCRRKMSRFSKTKSSYWVEDHLADILAFGVRNAITREVSRIVDPINYNMLTQEIVSQLPDEHKTIWDLAEELTANLEITKPEEVKEYMDYKNIIKMLIQ